MDMVKTATFSERSDRKLESASRGKGDKREVHVVTGGGGYPGFALSKQLAEEGHSVRIFDVHPPIWNIPKGAEFHQIDIREAASVASALHGADVVYHMAAFGMSGRDLLNKEIIEGVNIRGTENVIKGCVEQNVTRLVYTSTYNTIFGRDDIVNGDESLPYLAEDKFTDHYSKTKMFAEQKVLKANGSTTQNGSLLRTCALRLAGVYGPGEQRHLPRIVGYLEAGLVVVTYGNKDNKVDYLHVDNLVQAHIRAGEALSEEKKYVAAGQAYFISDGKPINSFQFFRPLFEGLGYKHPTVNIPLSVAYWLAFFMEWVHFLVRGIYNFDPILTRTEVHKMGVTHFFSIAKAERELGYRPTKQNDLEAVVKFFLKTGHGKPSSRKYSFTYYLINIIIAVIFATLLLSCLPFVK